MSEINEYDWARRRVEAVKGFYVHATIYVVVNLILLTIDLATGGDHWFFWPLIGWGVWVIGHGIGVFGSNRLWGREWEERKIQDLLAHRR